MEKPTAFGPLTHCKKYSFTIIFRDATTLSWFFPKSTGVLLPDLHCEQQNCKQGAKKKASQPVISPLCSCLFGGVTTTASLQATVWTCEQRELQDWENSHMISTLPKRKPLNMNYSAVWHCHSRDIDKMDEKLYEYRHNNTMYTIIAWFRHCHFTLWNSP